MGFMSVPAPVTTEGTRMAVDDPYARQSRPNGFRPMSPEERVYEEASGERLERYLDEVEETDLEQYTVEELSQEVSPPVFEELIGESYEQDQFSRDREELRVAEDRIEAVEDLYRCWTDIEEINESLRSKYTKKFARPYHDLLQWANDKGYGFLDNDELQERSGRSLDTPKRSQAAYHVSVANMVLGGMVGLTGLAAGSPESFLAGETMMAGGYLGWRSSKAYSEGFDLRAKEARVADHQEMIDDIGDFDIVVR